MLARAPLRKKLWLGAAAAAIFIATIATGYVLTPKPPHSEGTVGLDFIAFYTAGSFLNDGRYRELYDIPAFHRFQHDLAAGFGVDLGGAVGPWWNPPFYAWVFAPIARLAYPAALHLWLLVNVGAAAIAAALLCRMLPRGCGWRTWALVPVLIVLSTPYLHALSHGQNTCTSLLLLVMAVMAWRRGRPLAAGLLAGLLFYKPQLALVLAAMLVFDLGWRAALGLGITGGLLVALNVVSLPGTLGDYLHRLPANVHFVQVEVPYLWERHVTLKAFWRLLLQGRGAGEATVWVNVLTVASAGGLAASLIVAARARVAASRDRLIAATISCTPLLMPFYFDYDQLLLAVPAVLFATDVMRRETGVPLPTADRWLLRIWPIHFAWLMLNADIAERTRVNLAVPILAAVACLLVARAWPRRTTAAERVEDERAPLPLAA